MAVERRGILRTMSDPAGDTPATPGWMATLASKPARRRDAGAVMRVCPLLVSADAAWRSAYASRDHRCWAVRPPAPLVLAKQRELCLTGHHASCATFVATRGGIGPDDAGAVDDTAAGSLLWPPVRSTPLALEPSRGRTGVLPVSPGRTGGQALLVGLMVLAFLVLVIARTTAPSQAPLASPGAPGVVLASPSPVTTPTPVASTSASPAPSASPIGTPTPWASASAPPAPTVTPVPSTARTYKVKSGDRLESIAAQFGTTVKAIAAANGIENLSLIRVGQVLIIP